LRHAHFRKHYQAFLTDIRAKNPHTEILCILGLMDSALNDSLAKAVSTYVQFVGDQHIHTLLLPRQSPEDGFGADGHPSRTTHRKTAFIVADKLKEILNW
jgi:hypothetical protein